MAVTSKITLGELEGQLTSATPISIPPIEDILEVEDLELITQIYTIVQKYRSSSWIEEMSVTEMTADLMTLQASQVTVMYRFGVLTSQSDSIEERLKLARAKVRMQIKSIKQDYEENNCTVSMTADDSKDLSYIKTEDLWENAIKIKSIADFLKSMYFSVKDHIFMLNNTIQRLSRIEIQ